MKNKEEVLTRIIDNVKNNTPANLGPLVNKLMAEKVKEIIVQKQREISKEL